MTIRHPSLVFAMTAWSAIAAGCDNLQPGAAPDAGRVLATTVDNLNGTFTTTIDATDKMAKVHFDFGRRTEVPADSADWDLSFQRYFIAAHGMDVARLTQVDLDAVAAAPSSGYAADAFNTDGEAWYEYDSTTHVLTARTCVYVVRMAGAPHYAVQILSYYDAAGTPGFPRFRWKQL